MHYFTDISCSSALNAKKIPCKIQEVLPCMTKLVYSKAIHLQIM